MRSALCAVVLVLAAHPAAAQIDEPIRGFVVDARIPFVRLKEDAGVGAAINVTPANLPTRALGLAFGAHWYPVGGRSVALGIGGEYVTARGERALEQAAGGETAAPVVETLVSSIAPHLSLNFGKRNGWSYLSGGIGSAGFTAQRLDAAVGDGSRSRAIHYGGGARWFTRKRLAVSVDLRFYSIGAQEAAPQRPAFPGTRMMVISGGIAIR